MFCRLVLLFGMLYSQVLQDVGLLEYASLVAALVVSWSPCLLSLATPGSLYQDAFLYKNQIICHLSISCKDGQPGVMQQPSHHLH